MPFLILTTLFTSVITYSQTTSAATSSTLNFQGRLLNISGGLVADGSYNIEFKIYDSASLGQSAAGVCSLDSSTDDCWWIENRTITVKNGYFSVYLADTANGGTAFTAGIPWDQELWLTMNVNSDGEMTPRFKLTAVPYAFRAGALVDASGAEKTADDFVQTAPTSIQEINAAVGAIRLNQIGSGSLLQLQGDGSDVFTVDKTGSATLGSGITLGNSTNTTAGTIRWSGTDLEVYDGIQWTSLTGGGGGGTLAYDSFYAYDATGDIDVSAGWTDITLDTEIKEDTPFTHAADSATVTIGEDGWYELSYNVSAYTSSGGNADASIAAKLQENTGGGFTDIPGSFGYSAVTTGPSEGNVAVTLLRQFTAGDIVKIQAQRATGGDAITILTRANSAGLTIKKFTDAGAGGGSGTSFEQNGNSFGATAVLGTTDTQGLTFITDNTARVLIDSVGDVTINESLTVLNGLSVTGNSTISGTLSGLTGATFTSGNVDLNGGEIVDAGNITGVNGLTVSSGGSGNLTLTSASGLLILNADTLRRSASGTTTFDLLDSANTTLALTNSGVGVLNLTVDGGVNASSFTGSGSGLTSLNASNINTGTLADNLLSSNVSLLDTTQTFSALQNFSSGLVVGNTATTTTGAIRWSGTDFEGYDGTQWVSLTGGGGGGSPLLEGVLAFGKVAANGTALNIDGASVVRNSLGSYTVTLTTPATDANYTILLSLADSTGFNDPNLAVTSQTTAGFSIEIATGDNGTGADDLADRIWHFTVIDSNAVAGGGGSPTNAFEQNGNSFGATAILGTTDNQGLNIITNGSTALSIDNLGETTFQNSLTVTDALTANGGISVTSGTLTLGTISQAGSIVVNDGTTNTGTLNTASLTSNRVYVLPDADGTICLSSGNCGASGNFAEIGGNTVASNMELGTNNAFSLIFKTANTAQLTIDTSGNVNLNNGALQTGGTTRLTTAGALQNIAGLTVTSGGASITGNSTITGTLQVSNTLTISSGGVTITLGGLNVTGGINNNSGGITNAGAVAGATTITASGNINTTAGGLQTNSITRLTSTGALQNITTITASGNINTTGGVYQVNGVSGVTGDCLGGNNAYLNNISVAGGIITSATCRQTGTPLSDARLKENVVSLDNSILDNIGLVNTVNFNFKCENEFLTGFDVNCEDLQTGVIAQELAAIFPELVYQGDDGYYRVKYDALNIYTLKAVSELSKTINSIGDVKAKTVSTNETIRLNENGELININGLTLMSGGASIVGGIDNNGGGIANAGDVLGVQTLQAGNLRLNSSGNSTLQLTKDGIHGFTLFNDGALELKVNNGRAFVVQSQIGMDLFSVNTNGGVVQIGSQNSSPSAILFVLARKNTAGDPVGVNGAQYYNEYLQRFRCYQDDQWIDCTPVAVTEYILASNDESWMQTEELLEIPGNHRTWLDLSSVREMRLVMSVSDSGRETSICRIQYQTEGADVWSEILPTSSDRSIDSEGAIRGEWGIVSEDARSASEVQLRLVCQSTETQPQNISLSAVRIQVR